MQDRIGQVFTAVVIALRMDGVVAQISDPPIRTLIPLAVFAPGLQPNGHMSDQMSGRPNGKNNDKSHAVLSDDGSALEIGERRVMLGQPLSLRLESADLKARSLSFSLVPAG